MVLKFSRYASQMKPYICFFPREAAVLLICHFCLKNNFISVVFNYFYEMFHDNCVKNNLRAVDFVYGKRTLKLPKTFGNKARGRILKRVLQEHKTCQIFRKTYISYPLIPTRMFWDSPFYLITDKMIQERTFYPDN